MKRLFFLLLLCTLSLQCSKKVDYSSSVVIEKMYATSTAMGGLEYAVQNVFSSGEWRSMPARLPLDGVMLYLANPVGIEQSGIVKLGARVSGMQVDCASGSVAKKLQVFVDGELKGDSSCGERIRLYGRTSSVYIRASGLKKSREPVQMAISRIRFYGEKEGKQKELTVIYPEGKTGKVSASSVLDADSYRAQFLFDGSMAFGWVEGKKDAGIGESVTFKFDSSVKLTGMEIYTGYQRSRTHFRKNSAPVKLSMSAGKSVQKIGLKNSMGAQRVIFEDALEGKSFKLTIDGVRKGSKWQDTVISEIVFLGAGGRRIVLYDPQSEAIKKKLLAGVNSGLLKNFVGESFAGQECDTLDYGMELSLRANGSFVAWRKNVKTGKERYVMDGNWQLKKNTADSAEVLIFGKMHAVKTVQTEETDETSPYGTETYTVENETKQDYIFSDRLRIFPGTDAGIKAGCPREAGFFIKSARLNGGFN